VPADTDRSRARIEPADLLRLAALAADAETGLFARNPHGSGRYTGRLLGRALCQGAALHYVNGKNGVKDIWSFYAQYDDAPFPAGGAERGTSARRSSAGTPVIRRVAPAGASIFSGAHFRPHPAPTRPIPSGATSPPSELNQRRLWRPRQWS
jgi:hypothetical protein